MPEYVVTSNKEMRKIVLGEQLPICYPCEMDGDDWTAETDCTELKRCALPH